MPSKPKSSVPPEALARYERLVLTVPGLDRKGASIPYTSVNGNMFSFLDKDGLLSLRLPASEREAFMAKYDTALSVQYGAVMKEYVVVPDRVFGDEASMQAYFAQSYEHTNSLKPKPTTRKKKA